MIFIDTNVIISHVNEDDSKHSEAKLLLKNLTIIKKIIYVL